MIHGHTENMTARLARESSLIRTYQELEEVIDRRTKASESLLQARKIIRLLAEGEQQQAETKTLGRMLTLILRKFVSLPSAGNKKKIDTRIKEFFSQFDNLPRGEVIWFQNYKSEDANDPIMKEKLRQNRSAPEKATYIHIPKGSEAMKAIKSAYARLEADAFGKLADSLSEIFADIFSGDESGMKSLPRLTLLKMVDGILSAKGEIEAELKLTSKSFDPRHDPYRELMLRLMNTELANLNSQKLRQTSTEEKMQMNSYMSLDSTFGGSEEDVRGARLAFLA